METVIYSVLRNGQEAESAIEELVEKGFSPNQLSLVWQKPVAEAYLQKEKEQGGGSELEILVAGLHPVWVSDVGEVYTTGEMAGFLTGETSDVRTPKGSLKAALFEKGVEQQASRALIEGVRDGGPLFFIRSWLDDRADTVLKVLDDHDALVYSAVER